MAKNEEDLVHYVSVPPRLPENLSWMRKSGSTILAGVRRAWGIEEKELKLSKEALDIALHEDLDRAIADCLEIRRNLRRRALDEGYDPAVVDSVIVDEIASVLKKHRKAKARLAKEDAEQVRWLDPDLRKLEGGDKSVIPELMYWCIKLDFPLPRWLTSAFAKAVEEAEERLSWDAAFGSLVPKADKRGKQKEAQQRDARLRVPVFLKVRERKARKEAIDFADIADEIRRELKDTRVTESVAKRVYYGITPELQDAIKIRLGVFQTIKRAAIEAGRRPEDALLDYFNAFPMSEAEKEVCTLLFSQKIEDF